jgi:VanZ family protein
VKIPTAIVRAAFWLATLAVLVLTLIPAEQVQRLPLNFWDKAQHALAFGVLTGLGLWAWPQRHHRLKLLAGLVLLGGGIEVAQYLTGWRHGEWADWAADVVGVALVAVVMRRPKLL